MPKKLITVFGATGIQGGSIVDIFLTDPKLKDDWKVRGVTRDVTKDSAKKLAGKGVEVVAANLDDKPSLVKAMEGSHTVYGMTNYWDKTDMQLEIQQGKNLADAAVEAGVKHYIWGSLLNIKELSKGALPDVYHFDSKALVEAYIRTLPLPATFFLPGFYMSNLSGGSMMRPSPPPDGPMTIAMPIPSTAPAPLFDAAADTGKFVKGIVLHADAVLGKQVLGATAYYTFDEVLAAFRTVFPEAGADARFVRLERDAWKRAAVDAGMPDFVAEEMLQNLRLLDEFGYYGGRGLEESLAIVEDGLTSWEEHCRKAKPWAGLK